MMLLIELNLLIMLLSFFRIVKSEMSHVAEKVHSHCYVSWPFSIIITVELIKQNCFLISARNGFSVVLFVGNSTSVDKIW